MKKSGIILSSIILSSSLLFAGKSSFINQDTKVFMKSDAKKEIGKIDTATPIEVLSSIGNFREIKVTGWASYGFENVLFKDIGQRIFYLVLKDNKTKKAKELAKGTDSFGSEWRKVSYKVWVNKTSLSKKINDIDKKGQELFASRCGACHASPEVQHYTANQWPSIIEAMKPRAGLSSQEAQFINKYLQRKTVKGSNHE
ncbi:hypothetical protein [Sulfurimonas sp.]|uniref:hypothetical protein n=1 Tax=Sulfurimonas sp. TaxID=2022749 RepID=UPI0025D368F2|nr:hypothetical protein [Sulfurimonas sp.]